MAHRDTFSDAEFRQRVRRHAPSSLVPLIAAVGAQHADQAAWINSPGRALTPWALAEVTRTSIVFGNPYRQTATTNDVVQCCRAYSQLLDPELREGLDLDGFASVMLRMASEQMSHQQGHHAELSRSIALFEQTTPGRPLRVLVGDWARSLLGSSFSEYVSSALLFYVVACKKAGRLSLDWLDQDDMAKVVEKLDAAVIRRAAHDHFITDVPGFRALDPGLAEGAHPDLRRFGFNPLTARPIISGLATELLVPVPGLLFRKAGPLGIYYLGVKQLGNPFAEDVGILFEAYVGRHLDLMKGATVLPAIRYGPQNQESVDWIVVFDEAVLLVEVKSTRPTEAVRTGSTQAVKDLKRQLGRAVEQIDNTASLIRSRHPKFNDVPAGRPIIGLVLTMESFHVVNAPFYRQLLPSCSVPVRICSSYELERLAPIQEKTAGAALLEFVNDPDKQDWPIDAALNQYDHQRNPVLDQAWAALAWGNERSQANDVR